MFNIGSWSPSHRVVVANPQSIRGKFGLFLENVLYFFTTNKYVCFKLLLRCHRWNRLVWRLSILDNIVHLFKIRLEFWRCKEYGVLVVNLLIFYLNESLGFWLFLKILIVELCENTFIVFDLFLYLVVEAVRYRKRIKSVRLLVLICVIKFEFFL